MSRRRSRGGRPRPTAADPELTPLPDGFVERMESLLGDETGEFLAALATPAAGLRVNTLRVDPRRFVDIAPFPLEPLPFPPEGFRVGEEARPGAHPYHAAGLYYLQDPGAMVVGALPQLPREPRVLDLSAAPGGKATHLAARMEGRGVLVANDVHAGRARELAGNLERCGVTNAVVTHEAPVRLADRWPGHFDLVLVDAPCSGESMFHKSAAARREWSPAAVAGCARRQGELLHDARRLVRSDGVLLYSTCTFAPEENEQVLAELLAADGEFRMEPLPGIEGAEAAHPEWAGPHADMTIARALRLWPHRVPGAGHFVAALRRAGPADVAGACGGAAAGPGATGGAGHPRVAPEAVRLLRDMVAEVAPGLTVDEERLAQRGEEIHLLPEDAPASNGLHVIRAGWWLATVRRGWIEPSHHLAMGMRPEQAARVLDLDSGGGEAAAFLRGEVLRGEGEDGWVLVCVDGFPLGWGKRTRGVVKNHYPRGLRRR